jgi:Chaperone of endosialidase
MHSITRIVALVAGFVVLTYVTPSWGQPTCAAPGCNPTESDGNGNVAGGTGSLQNVGASGDCGVTAGCANTAFGDGSLSNNNTGSNNTASGSAALLFNTAGNFNTASGASALFHNTMGINNTASGFNALFSNTSGRSNTAVGIQALFSNDTGNHNTAVGGGALLGNTSGSKNTAVGVAALQQTLGTKNVAIGFQAGITLANGNNNIYIGNQGAGDESQTIRIGTAQAQTFIAGIAGAIVSNASPVEVDIITGRLGTVPSSARYKQDILPMGNRSEKVLELRPVTFAYKDDARKVTHFGLVAEEVAAVYPDLVTRTATGEVQTVKYQELIPMLLNELQRQRQALQRQDQALERRQQELAEVAMLRKELADLRSLVGSRRGQ